MNIGFTGTRSSMTVHQWNWTKRTIYQYLRDWENTLHHGDCVGADEQVHRLVRGIQQQCQSQRIKLIGHPPTDPRHRAHCDFDHILPEKPYLERNHDIVDACHLLIACPRGMDEELRSGTWAAIRYARKKHVPVTIIWPDGTTTEEL